MLLAGGEGSRLCLLSEKRAKPAVPFAAKYRIIDFALSNTVNSGIFDIGILTQYRPASLNQHIGSGRPWDLDRTRGGVEQLQPYLGWAETDWYKGTADAVYQNLHVLQATRAEEVLILSGDHVYKMDYNPMYQFHASHPGSVTVAVKEVPEQLTNQFGILQLGPKNRVVHFEEKPRHARSTLASMGIYIFSRSLLERLLTEDAADANSRHDFGHDLLPRLVAEGEVYAYAYEGYWADIGTVDSYYQATMDLTRVDAELDLRDPDWPIHTVSYDLPPMFVGNTGSVRRSLMGSGSIVRGRVENSVISPGVIVEKGAVVRDSIVMNQCWIGSDAVVDRAIIDKSVFVGRGARVGHGPSGVPNVSCPEHLSSGLSIVGKGTRLPDGLVVGRNCRIAPDLIEKDFAEGGLPSGAAMDPPARRAALK
ncbi:MAG: NTP transferase domain-containing protein [Candidatus Eisenbacteria bacterium]|nr:NTP transferase domain-containing protein [Candidatus Eisenbacteria bacterium]